MNKKTPFWEDLAIILSIFTLWPAVLHKETTLSKILMAISIVLLIWIFIRRWKRIRGISK
ncbi:MAG: hypothetical protein GX554_00140 [Elusimicrobia bacterium]|nr:hypothetical protein [Elusimicrobiota bacterium]